MSASEVTATNAPIAATDRRFFEEDLGGNLLLASALAPRLCRGCEQYHLTALARRAVGLRSGVPDRKELTELLGGLIVKGAQRHDGAIDIAIAGSADTAILALCANAALSVGGGVLARCRFRVLDRCPTPLRLCEAFGQQHGLKVTTEPYDLVDDTAENPADFVIFHSVLRFVPAELHVEVVRKLLGWLKPGGRVIASTSMGMSKPDRDWETIRDQVRKGIAGGTLQVAMDAEDFVARLGGEGAGRVNFPDSASLLQLFAAAGAQVEAIDDLSARPTEVKRNRLIAVLLEKGA